MIQALHGGETMLFWALGYLVCDTIKNALPCCYRSGIAPSSQCSTSLHFEGMVQCIDVQPASHHLHTSWNNPRMPPTCPTHHLQDQWSVPGSHTCLDHTTVEKKR